MIASNRVLEVKYGRSQVYCYAVKREELQRGLLKRLKGRNSQERDRGSYKSGLKTKLGLRPNSRDMVALIYK